MLMELHFVISFHNSNVSTLHYDVIMLGSHGHIPFHYTNVIMLLCVYVCRLTC